MESKSRRQLTLFLPEAYSTVIEKIRQRYNPVQYALIKAHLTLCREDEIENLSQVLHALSQLKEPSFSMQFEGPARFEQGKGVWMRAKDASAFNGLRKKVLQSIIAEPREQIPHITLLHPRNASFTEELFNQICKETFPTAIQFNQISLIEQVGGGKWETIQNFPLV